MSWNHYPAETAIRNEKLDIIKYLFSFKDIKEKYMNNDNNIFRLMIALYGTGEEEEMYDYILTELNITDGKLLQMINYKYIPDTNEKTKFESSDSWIFHRFSFFPRVARFVDSPIRLKRFIARVGKKVFIDNILNYNNWNQNALEVVAPYTDMDCLKFLLSYDEIKEKYLNSDRFLWRLLYRLFVVCTYIKNMKYIVENLKGIEAKMGELLSQRYEWDDGEVGEGATAYSRYSIVGMVAFQGGVEVLKYIKLIIGDKSFADAIFLTDLWGDNGIQGAIERQKLDNLKVILGVKCIAEKLMDDKDELHNVINKLSANFDESVAKYITKELDLSEQQLNELKDYKDVDLSQILTVLNVFALL